MIVAAPEETIEPRWPVMISSGCGGHGATDLASGCGWWCCALTLIIAMRSLIGALHYHSTASPTVLAPNYQGLWLHNPGPSCWYWSKAGVRSEVEYLGSTGVRTQITLLNHTPRSQIRSSDGLDLFGSSALSPCNVQGWPTGCWIAVS